MAFTECRCCRGSGQALRADSGGVARSTPAL